MTSREEVLKKIIKRAHDNKEFRAALIENPKETLEKVFKVSLPGDYTITVHEETSDTLHIVLPKKNNGELSDLELDAVSGGICYEHQLEIGNNSGANLY